MAGPGGLGQFQTEGILIFIHQDNRAAKPAERKTADARTQIQDELARLELGDPCIHAKLMIAGRSPDPGNGRHQVPGRIGKPT